MDRPHARQRRPVLLQKLEEFLVLLENTLESLLFGLLDLLSNFDQWRFHQEVNCIDQLAPIALNQILWEVNNLPYIVLLHPDLYALGKVLVCLNF